ncbi:fumarylacetoacetate hydrolase family protein [Streptomyces sp. NPDC059255]|uniref:fumarylacetoacetate hydrolase family protein n=1 Tax=Streptomyces sp. NPDC059255 TaxID=3346793 RepID=UPI0036BDFC3A
MTTPGLGDPGLPVLAVLAPGNGPPRTVVVWEGLCLPGDRLIAGLPPGPAAVTAAWPRHAEAIGRTLAAPSVRRRILREGVPVRPAEVRAPVSGAQSYCAIGNYRDQLLEAALDAAAPHEAPAVRAEAEHAWRRRRDSGAPYVAMTGGARIGAPFAPVELDADDTTLDWEVEIAAVIGHPTACVDPENALDSVAGYCVANDLTLRQAIFRSDVPTLGADWLAAKGRTGRLPLGPWLVPTAHLGDPQRLRLELRLNGQVMQSGTAADMLFSIAEVISHISHRTQLRPGDVVCTGSPAGFGSHHGRFLQPGDVLEASVEGLGTQIVAVAGGPAREQRPRLRGPAPAGGPLTSP